MSEKPVVSFNVGGLSVALWENEREGRVVRSVSVKKSFWDREKEEYDHRTVTLNLNEVSCLAGLLRKMEEAVINERSENPF